MNLCNAEETQKLHLKRDLDVFILGMCNSDQVLGRDIMKTMILGGNNSELEAAETGSLCTFSLKMTTLAVSLKIRAH